MVLLDNSEEPSQDERILAIARDRALRDLAVARFELARVRMDLDDSQAEVRLLREALKEAMADIAHYMQTGPDVPALPRLTGTVGV